MIRKMQNVNTSKATMLSALEKVSTALFYKSEPHDRLRMLVLLIPSTPLPIIRDHDTV